MSGLFVRLLAGALVALPFYVVIRLLFLKKRRIASHPLREILLCLFVLFVAGLIVLVMWPGKTGGQSGNLLVRASERLCAKEDVNFVPLYTIRGFFADGVNVRFVVNIIANVLMFSPIGFCLPLFWNKFQKWWKLLCIGVAFSAGIETVQLFIGRSVDVDDVALNVAGVMLGYLVFALLARFVPKIENCSR